MKKHPFRTSKIKNVNSMHELINHLDKVKLLFKDVKINVYVDHYDVDNCTIRIERK
jgi:hypothetical protein